MVLLLRVLGPPVHEDAAEAANTGHVLLSLKREGTSQGLCSGALMARCAHSCSTSLAASPAELRLRVSTWEGTGCIEGAAQLGGSAPGGCASPGAWRASGRSSAAQPHPAAADYCCLQRLCRALHGLQHIFAWGWSWGSSHTLRRSRCVSCTVDAGSGSQRRRAVLGPACSCQSSVMLSRGLGAGVNTSGLSC